MWKNFLIGLAISMLKGAAQIAYDSVWEAIYRGVEEAEKAWRAGYGKEKKKQVMAKVMAYLRSKKVTNWANEWIIKVFLSRVIDTIIEEMNGKLGHDWVKKAQSIRDELGPMIPIVD